jgi:hypothetical protein
MALLDVGLGASPNDVGDVPVALNGAKVLGSTIARVSAQMLASPNCRLITRNGCSTLARMLAFIFSTRSATNSGSMKGLCRLMSNFSDQRHNCGAEARAVLVLLFTPLTAQPERVQVLATQSKLL